MLEWKLVPLSVWGETFHVSRSPTHLLEVQSNRLSS